MIGRYKAYPEYKESGVEWFGYIPRSWSLSRLKFSSLINMGQSPSSDDCNIDGIGLAFLQGNAEFGSKYPTEKQFCPTSKKIAKAGELLFSVRAPVGALNIADKNYGIGRGLCSIRGNSDVEQGFLWWVLPAYKKQFDAVSTGSTFEAVSAEQVGNLAFGLPSNIEQQKIASFLEYETAKIDTLIAKQEKLIELLKEKRQAVISHAVTKGLNPNAPMRDSGVEWLGEVPEHWDVTKLKWKTLTTSGGTPATSKYEMYYQDGHIPWIRTTDLNNSKLLETPVNITPKALADTACSILPKNSVLLAMYGGAGSIGKHSLLMFEATINQAVCGIYPSSAFESGFLHYFYEFYRPFWMINAAGTRKDPNIGQDHIKEGKVVLPPIEEQQTIEAHIKKTLTLLDRLKDKAIDAIELAKERRTALISAAVTGKIDVRDWKDNDKWNG